MKLKVIGSGSKGNCYQLIANNGENIIIEQGFKLNKLYKSVDFSLGDTLFGICTHGHKDHSLGTRELMDAGIKVIMSRGTYNLNHIHGNMQRDHYNFIPIKHGQKYKEGDWEVVALNVKHDCPGKEPLCFLIKHPECGLTLFLTDTYMLEQKIDGLNNLLIEANFCEDIMAERFERGALIGMLRDRIFTNHLSLTNCLGILKANDLSAVNNILLIHLSDSNSHAERFKNTVYEKTLKTVNIAEPGLTLNWGLTPFD